VTDDLAGQQESDAPASAPAANSADIEKIRREFDERFKGMQRLVADKDRALADAQRQLENAALERLPDDDRAKALLERERAETAKIRNAYELLLLKDEYPDELPAFQKLLAGKTPKEQLDILRELRKGPSSAPAANPEPPDVDPNNPMRTPPDEELFDGEPMNNELADRILKGAGKTTLAKLRALGAR